MCPSCRYGLQFAAARRADVVTLPSAYLKAGAFAKVSALFEAAQAVVFDECHHLFPLELERLAEAKE